MRVAALQFDVRRGDVEANLARVEHGIEEAAARGVELVCLPEMWPTSFADPEGPDSPVAAGRAAVERVRERTADLDLAVVGSAYGEVPDAARPANRLHLLDAGRVVAEWDKVHLFSPTAEPESFTPGDAPPWVLEVRGARLSGVVCYDLRFPELMRAAFRSGADLLAVPAQWPASRASHWRALVLGRAVEGQAFVLAANRTGCDVVGRRRLELEFPGNSLVCDPHGRVLAEGTGREGLVVADLDLDQARRLRVRVPVAKDERPEVYRRWR